MLNVPDPKGAVKSVSPKGNDQSGTGELTRFSSESKGSADAGNTPQGDHPAGSHLEKI